MGNIVFDDDFDWFDSDNRSRVFQVFPQVFGDKRGFFSEILKSDSINKYDKRPDWFCDMSWIKQINRSKSCAGTIRGCHAQTGIMCQAKLVQALNQKLYDIITDGRPDSSTFGATKAYLLDPDKQNLLWVPRGFLHSFVVPLTSDNALFEYFCDNVYSKEHETGVNPMTIIPAFINEMIQLNAYDNQNFADLKSMFSSGGEFTFSQKDTMAISFDDWKTLVLNEYRQFGKVWYH